MLKAKVKFFSTSICDDSFGFEGALDHVHWTMCAEMGMWTMGAGVWTMGEKELLSLLVATATIAASCLASGLRPYVVSFCSCGLRSEVCKCSPQPCGVCNRQLSRLDGEWIGVWCRPFFFFPFEHLMFAPPAESHVL